MLSKIKRDQTCYVRKKKTTTLKLFNALALLPQVCWSLQRCLSIIRVIHPTNCSGIPVWAGRDRTNDASGMAAARLTDASQQLWGQWAPSQLVTPVIPKSTRVSEDPKYAHAGRHGSSSSSPRAGCRHVRPAAIRTFQII